MVFFQNSDGNEGTGAVKSRLSLLPVSFRNTRLHEQPSRSEVFGTAGKYLEWVVLLTFDIRNAFIVINHTDHEPNHVLCLSRGPRFHLAGMSIFYNYE